MNITFHGAAKEVGRSCIEINTPKSRIFLDSGIKVTEDGLEYPLDVKNLNKVDAVFLSHAHLDHSGALAYFAKLGLHCPIYCTEMTKKIASLLIKDSHKVELLENFVPKYSHTDIRKATNLMKVVQINKQFNLNDILVTFMPAGHIPGACSILLETNHKKILYTGDFNLADINSMKPAENSVQNLDYLICESTYGNRDHPERKKVETEFITKIKDVLADNGQVVIAAFAVGRIQELVMLLAKSEIKAKIFVDGMGNKINKLILESAKNFNDIKDYKLFKKALSKVKVIRNKSDREYAISQKGVVLTTSGMITGGPILGYIKEMWNDPKSAIFMTGFQVHGTNGRLLLETGKISLNGIQVNVKAQHYLFDFSAHAGLIELQNYVKKIKPKNIILQHGDDEAISYFSAWLKENKFNVIVPSLNEKIDL